MWDSDQDRRDREEMRAEAVYQAWRSGINPDSVDYHRVDEDYYAGIRDPFDAADREVGRLRQDQRRRMEES